MTRKKRIPTLDEVLQKHVKMVLEHTEFNRSEAAKILGISVRTLFNYVGKPQVQKAKQRFYFPSTKKPKSKSQAPISFEGKDFYYNLDQLPEGIEVGSYLKRCSACARYKEIFNFPLRTVWDGRLRVGSNCLGCVKKT